MRRLILLAVCGCVIWATCAAAAMAAGTVEGTVTPIGSAQEVEVCVVESRPSETCAVPIADGSYVLGEVPFGGAKIEFIPSFRSRLLSQYYKGVSRLSEATEIVLTPLAPTAENVDAALKEGGSIAGTVSAAEGSEPLAEVEACAVLAGVSIEEGCAETDAAGRYELHSLATGTYQVAFFGWGKNAAYETAHSQFIETVAGEPASVVDASLVKGARIEGRVTSAALATPLDGISVCLFTSSRASARQCTESDQNGAYSFSGLQAGAYEVGFSLGVPEISGTGSVAEVGGYAPQFYDAVATRAQAISISLLPAQTAQGVGAALAPPPLPQPPAPAAVVSHPIVAAPAMIAEPKPKKATCKKPKREKKIKGKVRCVKPTKRKSKKGHR